MENQRLSAIDVAFGVDKMATFPEVALRLNRALEKESSTAGDIAKIIEADPAMTAVLLRLANSAIYSVSKSIDNITRAANLVGLKVLQELSFGVSAMKTFEGIPNDLINVEDFWHHSLLCALASQKLANKLKVCPTESILTMGLLHDIGQLALFSFCPDFSRQALELSLEENDGLALQQSEQKVLGFSHTDVGAALADQWKFPANLKAAIAFHHTPDAEGATDSSMLVHVGNSIASLIELDTDNLDSAPEISSAVMAKLSIDNNLIIDVKNETAADIDELLQVFIPKQKTAVAS